VGWEGKNVCDWMTVFFTRLGHWSHLSFFSPSTDIFIFMDKKKYSPDWGLKC
jgi:hypothetical protein